jgi:hypothetical protein
MHWTAGFRSCLISRALGPPPVMCSVSFRIRVGVMNRCFRVLLGCLAACSLPLGLYAQVFQIDQSNDGVTNFYFSLTSQPIGQEFIPSFTSLNAVVLRTYGSDGPVTASFQVRIHPGSLAGPVAGVSDQAFRSDGWPAYTQFSFPASVSLTPGSTYVMELVLTSGAPAWWGVGYNPWAGYSQGRMILSGSPSSTYDLWFQEGVVIPEPGVQVLYLLGIASLVFARRRP